MLTSNIKIYNTDINIFISETQIITVYLDKETECVSIIKNINPITAKTTPLIKFTISDEFNQSIILPDSLDILYIGGKFNQPIILPYNIKGLDLSGEFSHKS